DAIGPQATSGGDVLSWISGIQRPLEALCKFSFQDDAIDPETRRLACRQPARAPVLSRLQAHVRTRFLLLAQRAFALLLPQQCLLSQQLLRCRIGIRRL